MKRPTRINKSSTTDGQRSADRFDTQLPVDINGIPSLTRNISATGMYVETDTHTSPGAHLHFTVEVVVWGKKLRLVCDGEVVRVDQKGDKTGVAVKLDHSFFADDETAELPAPPTRSN